MCEVVTGIMWDTFSVALKPLISFKLKYWISVDFETLILSEVFFSFLKMHDNRHIVHCIMKVRRIVCNYRNVS
jgi:hypothetical protein